MIVIGLALLLCGGGAFFWASPKIDTINKAQGAADSIGGGAQMQQMALSAQGISSGDAALSHIVYGVGILAVIAGAALIILGALKSRSPV